jgi:hypothetical protein
MSYWHRIQNEIREKGEVEFEGMTLRLIPGKEYGSRLEPGDTYVAERSSGPKLLTVQEVLLTSPDGKYSGWVVPVEPAYSFDLGECVGVEIVATRGSSSND